MTSKYLIPILVLITLLLLSCQEVTEPEKQMSNNSEISKRQTDCITIQSGEFTYSSGHYLSGQSLQTGYDPFGYNYQAHMFRGYYANAYLGGEGYPPYEGDTEAYLNLYPEVAAKWYWKWRDANLSMKWNDAWLSNKDCDGDGKLDRHFGYPSYIGSGAWLTNHEVGSYELNGVNCHYTYFVKIIAVPEGASLIDETWFNADGTEIGPAIWGEFAIIHEVYNDPCAGAHGVLYTSPDHAGLGGW